MRKLSSEGITISAPVALFALSMFSVVAVYVADPWRPLPEVLSGDPHRLPFPRASLPYLAYRSLALPPKTAVPNPPLHPLLRLSSSSAEAFLPVSDCPKKTSAGSRISSAMPVAEESRLTDRTQATTLHPS